MQVCKFAIKQTLLIMKKTLTLLACSISVGLFAQVHMDVLDPPDLVGSYDNSWADPAADEWGTPDMNDPVNRVIETLVLAYDGSTADSLCCETIINPNEVNGRIALVYRGDCTFVQKALNAQAAGAVAIVMISNTALPLIQLGGSTLGVGVTIPVFLITQADGALIRASLDAGNTVQVLLGNKAGFYENDLGMSKTDVIRPNLGAAPQWLTNAPTSYSIPLGAFVQNYGSAADPGTTFGATITQNGTILYEESVSVDAIAAGARAFSSLPDFAMTDLSGDYVLTYTVEGNGELSPGDNSFSIPFSFGSKASPVSLAPTTGVPGSTISIQPAGGTSDFESCIVLQDPNASRIEVTGVHFFLAKNAGTLFDEFVLGRMYRWDDVFTNVNDAALAFASVQQIYQAEYTIPDTGTSVQAYIPFQEPIQLEDNVRYLVCVNVLNSEIFIGANENDVFDTNYEQDGQPVEAYRNEANWILGFAGSQTTSVAASTADVAIGIEERAIVELAPYPNPTTGIFKVPLKGLGTSVITIRDAAGRTVSTHQTANELYTLDLRGEDAGVYIIEIQSAKGRSMGRLVLE